MDWIEEKNAEWIITPGLYMAVLDFESLLKLLYSAKKGKNNNISLMICGDTGVGKSLFTEIFKKKYQTYSGNKKCNILTVNIASFNSNVIESELFGHIEGAYTGATKKRDGFINKASNGVLILEEIGELNDSIQAKLLTFIEEGYFYPVGSEEKQTPIVQIIATTNKSAESFRLDFWSRFFIYYVPPIYQRRTDVLYYIYHFDNELIMTLTKDEVLSLLAYNWPGNVREIRKVCTALKWLDQYIRYAPSTFNRNKVKEHFQFYSILYRGNDKYTPNILKMREIFHSTVEKYSSIITKKFLNKLGYSSHELAFNQGEPESPEEREYNTDQPELEEFREYLPEIVAMPSIYKFDSYDLLLYQYQIMFQQSKVSPNNLFDIMEGDGGDLSDPILFNNMHELKKFHSYFSLEDWTERDLEFHKKIYEFRMVNMYGKNNKNELKTLHEIYIERIEMLRSINKAADSLGIPRTTFRDQIKKNLPSFYNNFLNVRHPHI
jgi:hypothetical protein